MSTVTTSPSTALDRRTYWCHECDMSVTLSPSSPSSALLCPHCHSDFLEEMDPPSPTTTTASAAATISSNFSFNSDNFVLDSPFLHRLISHLTHSTDTANNPDLLPPSRYVNSSSLAASRASVDALSTFKITPSFLDLDPVLFCAVCKDQFVVDVEAKQLPCNHIYHSDCIIPWLSQQNSCPLCRFRLPTDEVENEADVAAAAATAAASVTMTFGDLFEDQELLGLGNTLRHIARRNRLVFPALSAEASNVGPDNSVETVSSWARQGLVVNGGSGGGDGEIVLGGVMVNEDADAVMSEIRVSGSVSASF